jgi:hypothetical protein
MKRFRPSLRYSIRLLLVLTLLFCWVLGNYVNKLNLRQSAIAKISRWSETEIVYTHQIDHAAGVIFPDTAPPVTGILQAVLGPERTIDIEHLIVGDPNLTDDDLEPLQQLRHIRYLILRCPRLTNHCLKHLNACTSLEQLTIEQNANITEHAVRRTAERLNLKLRPGDSFPIVTDAAGWEIKTRPDKIAPLTHECTFVLTQ